MAIFITNNKPWLRYFICRAHARTLNFSKRCIVKQILYDELNPLHQGLKYFDIRGICDALFSLLCLFLIFKVMWLWEGRKIISVISSERKRPVSLLVSIQIRLNYCAIQNNFFLYSMTWCHILFSNKVILSFI